MIMMSAYGSRGQRARRMREGAYDYLHKPFRPDEVTMTLRKAEEREKLRREVEALRTRLGAGAAGDLVGARAARCATCSTSPAAWRRHSTTVLITGESGTGKELVGPRHPPDEPAARAALRRDQLRRHPRARCSRASSSAT